MIVEVQAVKVKGILFDMDGTLVNTNDLIMTCFDHATKVCTGRLYPHTEFIKYYGRPLVEGLDALFPGRGQEMAQVYRDYQMEIHDQMVKEFPGMFTTLQKLQARGLKMAVVTSKFEITARRALKCFNMEQFFTGVIGCGQVEKHKPDPEPSQKGLALLDLPGSDCLCVGDSPYDLISGKAAGCSTAAVNYSLFDPEQLRKLGKPDYIINKPGDLITLIDQLNKN